MEIAIVLCVIILVGAFVVLKVLKTKEIEQENQFLQDYMASMNEFYDTIRQQIDATRKYRHDLAKHIRTLEELLKTEQKDAQMKEYLGNFRENYHRLKEEQICGDEVVNAVLAMKVKECREKKIPLEIEIENFDGEKIEDADLVGILYNLLDNAVEENERITEEEDRGIHLRMDNCEDKVNIEVTNRICAGETVDFRTKKARKEEHGIGMAIIKNLAEKYQGSYEIEVRPEKCMVEARVVL